MEMFAHIQLGFETIFTPVNLFYCFAGVFLGTLVGVLPGLGPMPTIAMLLPATFALAPETSLIMLAGIYYGAQYGGSTTAILVNLPGEASSVVTALDGYKMARQGRAGAALATAAIGSFVAGTFATFVIALLAPPLADFALNFGPAEYFSLMVLGLIASVVLAQGSLLKALGMIVLGLLLGTVGADGTSGTMRYTLGVPGLYDGIDLIAISMGLFGICEIIRHLENETSRDVFVTKVSGLMPRKEELRAIAAPVARGTLMGTVLGMLPGGGAALSSFAAYAVEKAVAKEPDTFGNGAIAGVAAPEAANNAGSQTSFIPMLTLGIPSNPLMALMMGALIIQGIQPGPAVMVEQPRLFWGVIASMWVGNFFLLILNLPLVGMWARLLTIPYHLLYPAILVFMAIGSYSINNNEFGIWILALFGVVGYVFTKLEFEPAPLLLAFMLGPMMEEYLRRAMAMSRGDPLVFVQRPISAVLLLLVVVILSAMILPTIRRKREVAFKEE